MSPIYFDRLLFQHHFLLFDLYLRLSWNILETNHHFFRNKPRVRTVGLDLDLLTSLPLGPQQRQEQVADKCELGIYSCLSVPVFVSHSFSLPSGLACAKNSTFGEKAMGTVVVVVVAILSTCGEMRICHAPFLLNLKTDFQGKKSKGRP